MSPVTAIYLPQVGTFAKIVLCLLIILSVTTILITPDPTDDVIGVLHQQHILTAQPVLMALIPVPVTTSVIPSSDELAAVPLSADLLDLVCTRLC